MQKMKQNHLPKSLFLIACTLVLGLVISCSKQQDPGSEDIHVESAPTPIKFNFDCTSTPMYGDSILCAKWKGPKKDHIVKPLNSLPKGKFYAWPAGLAIDANTGAINLTASEAGLRYIIGYVKDGTTDTCHTNIIVSGIHYVDNIYVLESNDTLAVPYFNANPAGLSPCDPSDDNDYPGNGGGNGQGNHKCEYDDDEDDDNGDGTLDEPPPGQQANEQKLRVRTKSGIINLKKSLQDGLFGDTPQNGASKDIDIFYRLNDCSQKALRKIRVRLVYYEKKTDVPTDLVTEVELKQTTFASATAMYAYSSPRPPLIIVTRTYY